MIIWLASYPKSGNTWVRSFLNSLLFNKNNEADLSEISKIDQYPKRSHFINLVNEIDNLDSISGNVLEIGVARGMTTKFLAEHIKRQSMSNTLIYYALDTFNSFNQEDLEYEVLKRKKKLNDMIAFNYLSLEAWKRNFKEYEFIKPVKCDCSIVDYKLFTPIKLVFLDVDLYLPTKKALDRIYPHLVSGGTIAVDDCTYDTDGRFDGSFKAYEEFVNENNLTLKIVGNRLGIIKKT